MFGITTIYEFDNTAPCAAVAVKSVTELNRLCAQRAIMPTTELTTHCALRYLYNRRITVLLLRIIYGLIRKNCSRRDVSANLPVSVNRIAVSEELM